ncbi:helix-turn-helix transcriptional regulator [Mycetocola miduiensis]|uniref:MarR family protein n=1 Tax=Mycetocola miduiensis TaxID=995034 RepID=A0A1I4ZY88_9MICO|nr:MarR family transcriptional regulator [Mycetocola miduiensis]SFN55049.1 MarR family protein [Mycetocola miduiensis]
MADWTFLTHHAHVLLEVAKNPDALLSDIASSVGISARAAVTILNDLEELGYVDRERRGRRNHYLVHGNQPLRHPTNATHTVGELVAALADLP